MTSYVSGWGKGVVNQYMEFVVKYYRTAVGSQHPWRNQLRQRLEGGSS